MKPESIIFATKNRKYQTEFCFISVNGSSFMCQQTDLEQIEQTSEYKNNHHHIYLILRRPRVQIDPSSASLVDGNFKGTFVYSVFTKKQEVDVNFMVSDINSEFIAENFELIYPFNQLDFIDKNGKRLTCKAITLLDFFSKGFDEEIAAEVLYIGQSYGNDGDRKSIRRLLSHSKLQQIYSENSIGRPEMEIWILITAFDAEIMMNIVPDVTQDMVSDEEDNEHIDKVTSQSISYQQQINFTEAALIKYFSPEYNEIFTKSFPSRTHESYVQCFEIDLNSVIAEIQTDELGFLMFSKKVAKSFYHYASFFLHSRLERANMFDLGSLNYIAEYQFSLEVETIG